MRMQTLACKVITLHRYIDISIKTLSITTGEKRRLRGDLVALCNENLSSLLGNLIQDCDLNPVPYLCRTGD